MRPLYDQKMEVRMKDIVRTSREWMLMRRILSTSIQCPEIGVTCEVETFIAGLHCNLYIDKHFFRNMHNRDWAILKYPQKFGIRFDVTSNLVLRPNFSVGLVEYVLSAGS